MQEDKDDQPVKMRAADFTLLANLPLNFDVVHCCRPRVKNRYSPGGRPTAFTPPERGIR